MADDPIVISFRKEQRVKESTYWQISGIFSYYMNQEKKTYAVKEVRLSGTTISITTIDNSGDEVSWTGGGKQGASIFSQSSMGLTRRNYAGLTEGPPENEDRSENEIIISKRKPGTIYVRSQNTTRATEVLHPFPFPYYVKMPLYNKFLCFRALTGTMSALNESEFVGRIHFGVENLSLKEDGDDLREDIRTNIRAGIEAGIITENNGVVKISNGSLNSKTSFSKIYERYYLKINKTTLYDF